MLAAKAQRVSHDFRNVSLAKALTTLAEETTDYDITFLYSDMENIMVNRSVQNMDVLAAVKTVCKGQAVKVKRKDRCVFVTLKEKSERFALYGKVYDNRTRNEVASRFPVVMPPISSVPPNLLTAHPPWQSA